MAETMDFGVWCLIPPVIILVFALITKMTFEALLLGSLVSFIMYYKTGFFFPFVEQIQTVIADEIWIFVAFALFGYFVVLLQQSQGTIGFANFLQRWANTQKKALIATWLLGIVVFLDDFLNILTVSASMRDLLDRYKTPREMTAYVLDSTGAPVCVLIPLSTWAIFYADLAEKEFDAAGATGFGSGLEIYISSIPFMFYAWLAVILVPLVSLGVVPKIFGMKKAYKRVEETGRIYSEESDRFNKKVEAVNSADSDIKPKARNFIIPLIVVIAVMLYTEDLVASLLVTIAVMMVMYLPAKVMSFRTFCESIVVGISNMLPVMLILVGAYMIRESMYLIQMPTYVVNLAVPYASAHVLPMIAFIVVALLSFVTGSSWGVPAITVPVLLPLAFAVGANPIMTLGSIVGGAAFGSHACFYADATVLSAQSSGITNMEHALTQFPYAIMAAIGAVILSLTCGFIF